MSDPGPVRILFVCSGNICRSPMAEGMARARASQLGRSIEVRSAGTLLIEGAPAADKAIAVCAEIGINIAQHRSRGVTQELMSWADWVLVMEFAHARYLRDHFEDAEIMMLGHLGGAMEISDPIGGWTYQFRSCRDELLRCVHTFLERLP